MFDKLLSFLGFLALMAVFCIYEIRMYRDKDDKGPEMTGPATVKSHRVIQGRYLGKAPSRWNYMVTFALSDGEEIELYVTDDVFNALKEGQYGQLTWQGKRFYHFDSDA